MQYGVELSTTLSIETTPRLPLSYASTLRVICYICGRFERQRPGIYYRPVGGRPGTENAATIGERARKDKHTVATTITVKSCSALIPDATLESLPHPTQHVSKHMP